MDNEKDNDTFDSRRVKGRGSFLCRQRHQSRTEERFGLVQLCPTVTGSYVCSFLPKQTSIDLRISLLSLSTSTCNRHQMEADQKAFYNGQNLLDHFVEMHLLLLVSQHQNCSRNIQFDIYVYMKNDPIIKQTTFPVDVFLCLYIRSKECVDVDVPDKKLCHSTAIRLCCRPL
ncbi:hypothetical protein T12_13831 [Trichinella patagoniensis]|uniref:Uncharacterized protein n=1 Tax=Trichinella patagoniensis TaxID=990121 RepID=A0A0V0ZGM6_9BILA|nr:hypothetical protein T12_13831 [Trichinella patagoniensis]